MFDNIEVDLITVVAGNDIRQGTTPAPTGDVRSVGLTNGCQLLLSHLSVSESDSARTMV